jgi:hypothetical protein
LQVPHITLGWFEKDVHLVRLDFLAGLVLVSAAEVCGVAYACSVALVSSSC